MKPLIVLLVVFVVLLIGIRAFSGVYKSALSGRIALAAMLIYASIGHFIYSEGMTLMLPEFIPFKTETVYLSGVLEIFFAIGLLFSKFQKVIAYLLIVYLILVLPANIYAATKELNYQTATYNGYGMTYLWFRIPLQILFIVWTYLCAIEK